MSGDAAHVPPASLAAYPRRPGNLARPLVDGLPTFRRICEAVEAARRSVWVTVAYIERDAPMPDGRGTFFDVLDRAGARGLDVRALFWREPRLRQIEPWASHFEGNEEECRWLSDRGCRIAARWDRLPGAYCQRQKSWLIDAGETGEVAFLGGINPDAASLAAPGHETSGQRQVHDAFLEVRGPAATDVHHNFTQRWNEASERVAAGGTWPDLQRADDLETPTFLSAPAGEVPVQIARTVRPGRYTRDVAPPGGKPFPIAGGEESVLHQYLAALGAAERTLYLENQAIGSPVVVDAIERAVARGVEVVFVVPGEAHPAFVSARRDPRAAFFFEKLERLAHFDNFTLAALAANRGGGHYEEIYVHSKLAIVDDAWAVIGSANISETSLHHDTELNAALWDGPTARALRCALFSEHTGRDTGDLDGDAALRFFREIAIGNRDRRAFWAPLEGLAYALDPRDYGV